MADMKRVDAAMLYVNLRRDLLRASKTHRRAKRHPGIVGDHHKSHLMTVQRQLGALRQAYRRTQEAVAWDSYKRQVESRNR